ncbi:MAG: Gfo/Idh/MocA family oxidoreductase, partial [Gammaproteobacteria bacterium]|nr:Gfo/Idh/MocA family oxidoreductase [Gammaproteobacteria bacterium]
MENLDRIGLAIIGCGTIGRIRAELARQYPGVDWLGLCDISAERGKVLADDVNADFFTTSAAEIVARPEVNAVMVLTDENNHTEPALLAIEAGHKKLFIEKPLATDPCESAQILEAITANDVDARIAYTQRFRRRFLTIKERLTNGQIGDVHSVITRAFMNRMVPIATIAKTT